MHLKARFAAMIFVVLMAIPASASAHTVNVVLRQGSGGGHFSSHFHSTIGPTDCGGGSYTVDFYLSWGQVTANTVRINSATLKFTVHKDRMAYRNLEVYDNFGNYAADDFRWDFFGVGTHYRTIQINKTFRHDGNNAVAWTALTNHGGSLTPRCGISDTVLAS